MDKQKAINRYTYMKRLKKSIVKAQNDSIININTQQQDIKYIYHQIETEKMSGSDMYAMMAALQHQLRKQDDIKRNAKVSKRQREFDSRGGISEFLSLQNYLTDMGVNVHELN